VGNINRDVKLSPVPPGKHLFEDGETSVGEIWETIGGGGANSACMAASLGARVAFLGKAGQDELGNRLEQALERHGVTTRLARDGNGRTGTSVALAFDTGHRHFLSSLPNNASLSWADLQSADFSGFAHLLRADIWFSESMLFEGNRLLFSRARDAGLDVSIDLNWDPQWGVASAERIAARKEAVRDLLPMVTLAHGNVRELNQFADSSDLMTTLQRLTGWGAKAVVVHMGREGAGYFCEGKLLQQPPEMAQRQVNLTGTGDLLSVCMMLLRQQDGISIQDQLRIANGIVRDFVEGKFCAIAGL
jgi:sugar/nucleoside kinase (ribokinase family)